MIPNFGQGSSLRDRRQPRSAGTGCKQHWGDTLQPALVEHIELTAIAVGIGFVLAFGARARSPTAATGLEQPISIVAALLYTIPSIALFQLLVPFTGLTTTTIEIPLVAYTLVILSRTSSPGCAPRRPEVLEAARGMGLTPRQILTRVELPLAAAGDHRRAADRRRLDDLDRDDRRVPDLRTGLGYPIFYALAAADAVQDRDLLGGRRSPSALALALRRRARARSAASLVPWTQGGHE